MVARRPVDAVPAGQRGQVTLELGTGPDGAPLALAVHVVHGQRPGPTVALLATAHGDEWGSVEPIRRLLAELDPAALKGRVLAVPLAHPPALAAGTRNAHGEPDHNRVFPGGQDGLTERLVAALVEAVLERSDAVVDFHGGGWGHLLGVVTYGIDHPDASVNAAAQALARAYGWPYLRATAAIGGYPGPRSVLGWYAAALGRPAIMVGIGGAGFGAEWDERWTVAQLDGLRNALRHLGQLDDPPELPARFLHFETARTVAAPAAGLLAARVGPKQLGAAVQPGEPLGELWDPASLERIATLNAPCRGILFNLRGNGPVKADQPCYVLADLDAEGTRWESA
jgi:predicted deacylase